MNAGSVFADGLRDVGHALEVVQFGGILEGVQVLVDAVRGLISVSLQSILIAVIKIQ